ncbi:unnamed protein product [Vitrella brassicaformis CCMP3155]|uniref:ABC transporter domain-containing protein n=1 Tax=Vitrella brassicaformis (strain CCMP3155) TaxID=1169540 RepID=A0A0G4H3T7_VITBC|nr:unnamed protein product [Vitrella brassicaformis CCMP3155]|eukprot:CEM38192.1 unnamed protein product [Vitrella brassicaformis CCMP3155]
MACDGQDAEPAIEICNLSYHYEKVRQTYLITELDQRYADCLTDISLKIAKGSRVLVVGGNGAGKSTLLSILGGRKMVPERSALVLGRPAFHDSTLSNDVMYLGEWWKNEFFMDVPMRDCVREHLDDPRFQVLRRCLDVDLDWRISRVSDGQRRRCQLLAHLATRRKVYIMDEVTTDLDVVGRDSLMRMLRLESERRGVTILYATHIFDNMEGWPTHILYLRKGQIHTFCKMEDFTQYHRLRAEGCLMPLYTVVREWLYEELHEGNSGRDLTLTDDELLGGSTSG